MPENLEQPESAAPLEPLVGPCDWHYGDEPIEADDSPGCPNCGRLLNTRTCESCHKEFLDWSASGFDDVMAGPSASSSGDLCCTGCISRVERELEEAEESDEVWHDFDDVP